MAEEQNEQLDPEAVDLDNGEEISETTEFTAEDIAGEVKEEKVTDEQLAEVLARLEEQQGRDPSSISVLEELSQRQFDLQMLYESIRQVRASLATAKLNFILARDGLVPSDAKGHIKHPESIKREVFQQRGILDKLVELGEGLDKDDLSTLYEPSKLEI